MSMTPKTWSISALAIEFDMDRRTVAARLRHISPCGERNGHAVWNLADAAPALAKRERSANKGSGDNYLDMIFDRLTDWEEIEQNASDVPIFTFDQIAQTFGVAASDVLVWIRAGLPYVEKGDPSDGAEYLFHVSTVLDWLALLHRAISLAEQSGHRALDGRAYRDVFHIPV